MSQIDVIYDITPNDLYIKNKQLHQNYQQGRFIIQMDSVAYAKPATCGSYGKTETVCFYNHDNDCPNDYFESDKPLLS